MKFIFDIMASPAGVATTFAVAIMLAACFRRRTLGVRAILLRHGFAAAAVLGLLVFTVHDTYHTVQTSFDAHLLTPAIKLHILPTGSTVADSSMTATAQSSRAN